MLYRTERIRRGTPEASLHQLAQSVEAKQPNAAKDKLGKDHAELQLDPAQGYQSGGPERWHRRRNVGKWK